MTEAQDPKTLLQVEAQVKDQQQDWSSDFSLCIALPYTVSSFSAPHQQLPAIRALSGVENVPKTLMPRIQNLVGQRVGRRSGARGRIESLLLLAPTLQPPVWHSVLPSGGLVPTCPKIVPDLGGDAVGERAAEV